MVILFCIGLLESGAQHSLSVKITGVNPNGGKLQILSI